jgi:tetratricopeptide (TPR) repeat protein
VADTDDRKSQLAVEYSYSSREAYPDTWVFWVHASGTARFVEGYSKIAERVKPPGWDKPEADLLLLVYNWLSDETNGRWLMIIDNADDMEVFTSTTTRGRGTEDDLTSKSTTVLLDMIPQSSNGSILITSRSRDVAFRLTGDYADIIQVNPMDRKEAVALLQNQLRENFDQSTSAQTNAELLVEALDCMPLAISQAASYISQRSPRATVAKYVQDLHKDDESRNRLLKVDLGDTRRDGTASNSIIATWQISFEHMRKETPSATRLLSLMSLFHRQGIPEAILEDYYQSDNAIFEDDLTILLSFSLIATDLDGSHFQMHRLVQFSTIKWLEMHNELNHWKDSYAVLVDKHYLDTEIEDDLSYRVLFPHAQTALAFRPSSDKALKAWASILFKAMADAYHTGCYQVAHDMGRRSLEVREELLGMENLDTLSSVSRVATALRLAGRYEEALPMYRRAYQGRKKVLGAEDPLTLSSLNSVGLILSERGDYEEAELMHRRSLQIQEKVLGLEQRSTLQAMNDLGVLLTKRGKYNEAEVMHRRALEKEDKLYGKNHEWTLATLDNLGLALGKQGKFDEAVLMHRRALEGSKRRFGETHPETLICARNVAAVLTFMSKHEEAEALHRQVLCDSLKVLGEEHPFTLFSYCNLGSVLHAQAKYEEAETAHQKALAKRREVLGVKHPHTLSSMHNLATTINKLHNPADAITLMERCFRLRTENLGGLHPDTVKSRNLLRDWTGREYDSANKEPIGKESTIEAMPKRRKRWNMSASRLFALALIGAMVSILLLFLLPTNGDLIYRYWLR